jgi:hypothetical protein
VESLLRQKRKLEELDKEGREMEKNLIEVRRLQEDRRMKDEKVKEELNSKEK